MKNTILRKLLTIFIGLFALLLSIFLVGAENSSPQDIPKPSYPDISPSSGRKRGTEAIDKLTPELRILYTQYEPTRGGAGSRFVFTAEQLSTLFGINDAANRNPAIDVALQVDPQTNLADLKRPGVKVYFRAGDMVFAQIPVRSLESVARGRFVQSMSAMKGVALPPAPAGTLDMRPQTRGAARGASVSKLANEFDSQTYTGKGVIVGVVDSGIDWQHKDFIKPDGTSRILYIWDLTDDSFNASGGRIGTRPPILEQGGDPGPGTVYTNAQINAALKGQGTVNSMDHFGHGTASAGTAAGNGRATGNGIPEGTYKGVAPEADLIIVKAGDCNGIRSDSYLGTYWIAQIAKERHQPVVINHSYGNHFNPHDGNEFEERLMNWLVGPEKPGIAATVSAGNEGLLSMHADGRFGPKREGQPLTEGWPIEVNISEKRTVTEEGQPGLGWLTCYFDRNDDWGLEILGSGDFLVNDDGKPLAMYIFKVGDAVQIKLGQGQKAPTYWEEYKQKILEYTRLAGKDDKTDQLVVPLPAGSYYMWPFGPTANVRDGRFNMYIPNVSSAEGAFTIGASKKQMVGSPGNAANAITVGAYDFRDNWLNSQGSETFHTLSINGISNYSSPGGLRADGVYKPDIAAPASYAISAMSEGARLATSCVNKQTKEAVTMVTEAGPTAITRDGFHIAWNGTSAAAPYAAGVIALMIQKNPTLNSKLIKETLAKSATKGDAYVGAVPNPEWGYGKINPAEALRQTPSSTPVAPSPPRPRR